MYDVTRRETFTNLSEVWLKEVSAHATVSDCVKIVVGNKIDRGEERAVTRKEGLDFAKAQGCLFVECSAKSSVGVTEAFEELTQRILETPTLLEQADGAGRVRVQAGADVNGRPAQAACSC